MAARAVEAGDIVLDEGNEGTKGDRAVGGPGIVDPNDGGDLEAEDQEVERADDGHSTGQAGFFKQPAGDGIRLAVESDKPPSAEDIERFCPQERDHREREKGDFKRGHGLGEWRILDVGCWMLDGLQKCEMRNAKCGMRQWRSSYALRGYGGIREGKFWILNF
jgi:hypothetical protein